MLLHPFSYKHFKMKIRTQLGLCTLLWIFSSAVFAENPDQPLIPKGWTVLFSAKGDLNKDKIEDLALIIEQKDLKNIQKNNDKKNLNPRHLLVFIKQNHQYQLIDESKTLPTRDDAESSCRMDPLGESEGISIHRGVLQIHFSYFMSCGGWEWPHHTYTFRLENKKMKLIGFDYFSFHRSTGEETVKSYNFSTLKVKNTTGGNQFEGGHPKSTWGTFKPKHNFYLSNINFDDFYNQFEY